MPLIYILLFMNIKVVIFLALIASFLIKNNLVISYTTDRTIPSDGKGTRPDKEGKRTRLVDIIRMRLNTNKEETGLIDVKGSTDIEELVDIEELTNAEGLGNVKKLLVIYYKY